MSKGAGLITTAGNLTGSGRSIHYLVDGYLESTGIRCVH